MQHCRCSRPFPCGVRATSSLRHRTRRATAERLGATNDSGPPLRTSMRSSESRPSGTRPRTHGSRSSASDAEVRRALASARSDSGRGGVGDVQKPRTFRGKKRIPHHLLAHARHDRQSCSTGCRPTGSGRRAYPPSPPRSPTHVGRPQRPPIGQPLTPSPTPRTSPPPGGEVVASRSRRRRRRGGGGESLIKDIKR